MEDGIINGRENGFAESLLEQVFKREQE